ncbi:hypothetical protein [Nocardia terpenica]|uniref:YbaB/EbfC family DNA-binding protein n=1 Tax=Nocardia terpenica TaxID=455432 RepID=A0A291RP23_9NOCA|nr:hypothetical protein [Nocardia terpenica]ATL69038.1 hypothetical protein CRH09_25520 [Nocardia terpenica]
MTDIQKWERQLQYDLAEIRRNSQDLANAVTAVRGRGVMQDVFIEVNADGDITDLQIAPGAMRWTTAQLTSVILDCHRKARADARAKVERLVRKADPRIRSQLQQLHGASEASQPERRPMTEAEIQAADDEYFERMNRLGWRGGQ